MFRAIVTGASMFAAVLIMGAAAADAKGQGKQCRKGYQHCFDRCQTMGGARTGTRTREAGCAKKCGKQCAA